MNWLVYIIQTENNKLYTGVTKDLERRFIQHLSGIGGAKFFYGNPPMQIVYTEGPYNCSDALVREAQIKKLTRSQKEEIVRSFFPHFPDQES